MPSATNPEVSPVAVMSSWNSRFARNASSLLSDSEKMAPKILSNPMRSPSHRREPANSRSPYDRHHQYESCYPYDLPAVSCEHLRPGQATGGYLCGEAQHRSERQRRADGPDALRKQRDWRGYPSEQEDQCFTESHNSLCLLRPEGRQREAVGEQEAQRGGEHECR